MVAKDIADKLLTARMPDAASRNTEDQRQGLAPRDLERLLEVIQPGHPENPWSAGAQVRNNLLVRWYLKLGLRRAELLGVRVADINFQAHEVLIARRPDDGEDPRINKPDVKTGDKLLPLDPALAKDTHDYIVRVRRGTGSARRHPYLFVAIHSGAPLSLAAVNLVFMQLKRKVPGLPDDLSPHVLRHTWNDRFSELADREGFEEAEEKKMRSRLQGWSPTSGTAAKYTRRHVRKKAREASLSLQAQLDPEGGGQ
jgi:integrase